MVDIKKEGFSPDNEDGLYCDACNIIEQARKTAYRAVNETLIKRNWLLGMRIQHEVLKGERAEYGEQVIEKLASQLTNKYGRGFKKTNIYLFVTFYLNYPNFFQTLFGKSLGDGAENIFQSLSGKSSEDGVENILQSLSAKSVIRLSWSHYSIILQESNEDARDWYEQEAAREMWSVRALQ